MDGATRARVVEALPSEWEELLPPEGDEHREAASDALETLRAFYRSTGRRVYVSSNRRSSCTAIAERISRRTSRGTRGSGSPNTVIHDVRRGRLLGHRLPSPASATADRYEPIAPEAGRVRSQVLDLDLVLDGERLRFHAGTACLLDGRELVERLEHISREAEARARAETERADAYERKLAEYERRFGKLT